MLYGRVRHVDKAVSRCVLGTSGIRTDQEHRLLDAYVEMGGNCLDTARVYGGGRSEEVVGRWLRMIGPGHVVVLAKGAHPPHCTPSAVARDLSLSLDNLGLSCIDLYLLHRDDPSVPVGEFVDALDAERSAGRIRAYGVSNWTRPRLAEANRYATDRGRAGLVALSNHFSLARPAQRLYPGCETVDAEFARSLAADSAIALFPWSSQARGFFAEVPEQSLDPNVWRCWGTPDNFARRQRAGQLATARNVPRVNIALSYVLHQPFPTFPIIGPQDVDQLAIAVGGLSVKLDAPEVEWLEYGSTGGRHE